MNPQAMTLEQMREPGLAALRQPLGSIGMVRFLQPSEMGWGHDTEEACVAALTSMGARQRSCGWRFASRCRSSLRSAARRVLSRGGTIRANSTSGFRQSYMSVSPFLPRPKVKASILWPKRHCNE
jgi:hypothetical protein